MRILHLTSHLEIGGIGMYVLRLARAQTQRKHAVFVASEGGALLEELAAAHVTHWPVPLRVKSELHPRVWQSVRALEAQLRATPVDVLHAHTRVAQVAAAVLSRLRRVPYVTTCHGFYRRRLGRRWCPCWGRMAVAISRPVERHLTQEFGLPEARVRWVPTGLEFERAARPVVPEEQAPWLQALQPGPGERVLVTMARLVPSKGVDVFLRALAEVLRVEPLVRGVVIGDGQERHRLERLARELGLQGRVFFAGLVEDPVPLLSLCHLFVYAGVEQEGLGLAILEGMARGLPVVAARVGGVTDAVEHGYAGFLVPPGDVHAMSERMRQLLTDPGLMARMGVAARAAVTDRFAMERMLIEMDAIYRQVTAPG